MSDRDVSERLSGLEQRLDRLESLLGTLNDPFHRYHMGITAENVAEKYGIGREQQDEYALLSNQRASAASRLRPVA